jgi:hypothetical protein
MATKPFRQGLPWFGDYSMVQCEHEIRGELNFLEYSLEGEILASHSGEHYDTLWLAATFRARAQCTSADKK